MRQLRRAQYDVTNGVNARLGRFHPFVSFYEAALRLYLRLVHAGSVRVRLAANCDQNLFSFQFLLLAVGGESDSNASFRLLNPFNLGAGMEIDAFLPIHARKFLRYLFILERHHAGQHFENSYISAEGFEDRGKLHPHCPRSHYDQRFRNCAELQNFNVGQNSVVGLEPRNHPCL